MWLLLWRDWRGITPQFKYLWFLVCVFFFLGFGTSSTSFSSLGSNISVQTRQNEFKKTNKKKQKRTQFLSKQLERWEIVSLKLLVVGEFQKGCLWSNKRTKPTGHCHWPVTVLSIESQCSRGQQLWGREWKKNRKQKGNHNNHLLRS